MSWRKYENITANICCLPIAKCNCRSIIFSINQKRVCLIFFLKSYIKCAVCPYNIPIYTISFRKYSQLETDHTTVRSGTAEFRVSEFDLNIYRIQSRTQKRHYNYNYMHLCVAQTEHLHCFFFKQSVFLRRRLIRAHVHS